MLLDFRSIFCACHFFFHGKTIRSLLVAFREQCCSIVTGKVCSKLINHICENHNADRKVLTFAVILRVTAGGQKQKTYVNRNALHY